MNGLREAAQNMVRVWHEYDDEGQQATAVELLEAALATEGACEHRWIERKPTPYPPHIETCADCTAVRRDEGDGWHIFEGQPYRRPADGLAELVAKWRAEQADYPKHDAGVAAAAAMNTRADELEALIDA